MTGAGTVSVADASRISRLMIMRTIATHFPDWRVIEADSGAEALAVSDDGQIDIMTLAVNMPGMKGTELRNLVISAAAKRKNS